MEEKRNTCRELVGNPEGIIQFGRPGRGYDTVTIDVKETGWRMWMGLIWLRMRIRNRLSNLRVA
jgi:hypothetical protein